MIIKHTWRRFEPAVAEGRLLSVHNSTAKPPRLDLFCPYKVLKRIMYWAGTVDRILKTEKIENHSTEIIYML